MSKHTRGEWKAMPVEKVGGELEWYVDIVVREEDRPWHAAAYGASPEEAEANAHLIAAAPDLLAVLGGIVTLNGSRLDGDLLRAASAAIAKTRNESIYEDAGENG
jgi:hypothetical protein